MISTEYVCPLDPSLSSAKRTLDAAASLAFFVFYNFVEGKIVEVYDNADDDLLQEVSVVWGRMW